MNEVNHGEVKGVCRICGQPVEYCECRWPQPSRVQIAPGLEIRRDALPEYCGCCGCIKRYCICSCCCGKKSAAAAADVNTGDDNGASDFTIADIMACVTAPRHSLMAGCR